MIWLTTIWARIQGWVLAIAAGALSLAGVYLAGRQSGKADAKVSGLEDTIKKVRARDEEVSKLDAMDDAAIRDRARKRMREHSDK